MSEFAKFIPSIEGDEKYVLAHIMKNKEDIHLIKEVDLNSPQAKLVYLTLIKLFEDDYSVIDKDILQKENININIDYIEAIDKIVLKDKKFLESCVKNIIDFQVKLSIGDTVQQFLTDITDKGDLNYSTIQGLANDILYNTIKLTSSSVLKDYRTLVENYRETLKQRIKGDNIRTLGFKSLDNLVARPGAGGEMTTLFGMKGSGKSLLAKCMENMCVSKGVCVLSVNLEMTDESNMDRRVSIITNNSLSDLLDPSFLENRRSMSSVDRCLDGLAKQDNYLYYSEPECSLADFEDMIYKAKHIFKERGVLPEDEYILITIDLTEQIEELVGKSGTDLKPGVNRLHQFCIKHNVHILNILQSNESVFRGGKSFSSPEACESYTLQTESVEGGSVYAARSRAVFAVNRPNTLKRRYFPDREEEWDLEHDLMWVNLVKQNDGKLGRTPFAFTGDSFRILPYQASFTKNEENKEDS